MFGKKMFQGKSIQDVATNLLGCTLNFPTSSFPIKKGTITEVQWYGLEDEDPQTTEDKQGDALLITPGQVFIFEAMGQNVLLISALSAKTRACVRINAVHGIADRAHMLTRVLGITSFNRDKYNSLDLQDAKNGILFITKAEIKVPKPEIFTPRRAKIAKGLKITLPEAAPKS